jgi:hypothetical protein
MSLKGWIADHPLLSTFVSAVVFFATVWPVLSKDTVPEFLAKHGVVLTLPSWYYALVLALGAAVILLQLIVIKTRLRQEPTNQERWAAIGREWKVYQPVEVRHSTFRNQEVVLDGKRFSDCKFYNVTFKYNGTTPVHFVHNEIVGSVRICSDNPSVDMAASFFYSFGVMRPDVNYSGPPK